MKKRAHTDFADSADLKIFTLRGQRVIFDADLARLYGVPTFRFNETFKRNKHRFPSDFAFQLTALEFADLKRQLELTNKNSSQSAMSSDPSLALFPPCENLFRAGRARYP